jgi:hypothetical protein
MQDKNFIIDLDGILNKTDNTPMITESVQHEEPVTETVPMDWDEVIAEWFYRLPKGFAEQPYTESELEVLDQVIMEYKSGEFKSVITEKDQPATKSKKTTTKAKKTATKAKVSTFTEDDKQASVEYMVGVIENSGISQTAVRQMEAMLNKMTPEEVEPVAVKFQSMTITQFFNGGWETFKRFWPLKGDKVGTGRGELMAVMAIKGASSGGTGMKDLQLSNGTQWEVKEDPYSIRMAKSGFAGLFEYVDEMRTFYKYLIGLQLDNRAKDRELEKNLKAAFNDDTIANEMFKLLTVNFRGDGFKSKKSETDEFKDAETFFERVKISAELPASVIELHYQAFITLKKLRKELVKNTHLLKTAKLTVKTQDDESEFYISKDDAEKIKNADVDSKVNIQKGKLATDKARNFMFNLLRIFDHPYSQSPDKLVKGFQKQKNEYFGEVEGVLYYMQNQEKPLNGQTDEFIVYGISQGQGKLSLRDKYINRGYTWIDKQ